MLVWRVGNVWMEVNVGAMHKKIAHWGVNDSF